MIPPKYGMNPPKNTKTANGPGNGTPRSARKTKAVIAVMADWTPELRR